MISEKVCIYNKFGNCKLMGDCKFFHTEEICQDVMCEVKNCNKRHPSPCKFFLHYGACKFETKCRYDHNHIKDDVNDRMKALEEMCTSLKNRCDQVNEECNELREDVQRKGKELHIKDKECQLLKEANQMIEKE